MSSIDDLLARSSELLKTDVKSVKKQQKAEKAFHSELAKTNKKRKRTKNKRNYSGRGYSYVYNKDGKLVLEHRKIMEEFLGRELLPHESVTFKDGDKSNLDISNLRLGVNPRYKGPIICPHCQGDITLPESGQA